MVRRELITKPMRTHPEFEKIVKTVMAKNLMNGNQIYSSRVTLAMVRQYKKYPELLKELENTLLK